MFVIEEYCEGRLAVRPLPALYLGQGEGGGPAGVAVQVDVAAEVVRRGQDHYPRVVHPLASLPLSRRKVCQVLALAFENDVDGVLKDILW